MAIIRIHTGSDGKSHFQEIVPKLEPRGDKSETAELIPGSGIIVRRFEPTRSKRCSSGIPRPKRCGCCIC